MNPMSALDFILGFIGGVAWTSFLGMVIRDVKAASAARRHVNAKIAAHEAEQRAGA